jgi:protein KRI1
MSSANPAVAAALTAVESRRAAQRQAELEDLESDLDDNEVSDESDEEEDEYGEELTPAMDAAILRTLRLIRSGKGVYEGEKVIEGEFKTAGFGCWLRPGRPYRFMETN